MQANKFYHIISHAKFLPSENLPPPPKIRLRRDVNTVRATSISISDNRIRTREVDDEAVAFWDYQFLFTSQRLEVANPIKLKLIDGTFPIDFPSGTYYLTGPGLFIDDYGSTIHPLDGHGYVRAFEIDGPKREVKFSAKYVKTEAQIEECDPISGSWRFTHRGPFSVLKGGKKIANTKVMKNVANTSILKWGERLFCLWEGGTPYEIHPETLDTIGSLNLMINDDKELGSCDDDYQLKNNGSSAWDVVAHFLKPILYGVFKMPPKRLLSHYKIDHRRGRLLIMTCNAEDMVLPQSHCTFYEFDVNFNLLQKQEFTIAEHLMIHDWAFTDTHYILFGNRVKLDILGSVAAISGLAPMISALSVNQSNQTSPIYLLPRFPSHNNYNTISPSYHDDDDDDDEPSWKNPIEVPQLWLLHIANAFQDVDTHGNFIILIHATTCAYQWFNFHKMFGYNWQRDMLDPSTMNCKGEREPILPHLVEVSIKLNKNGSQQECSIKRLSESKISSDFPMINPRHSGYKHRYVYAASSSGSRETLPHFPFDMITKMDTTNKTMHTWSPGDRRFLGEPMFVSRGFEEDDGYLLVIEYVVSHRRCNLLILDPRQIGEASALVARYEVPRSLTFPLGFHGTWTPKQ